MKSMTILILAMLLVPLAYAQAIDFDDYFEDATVLEQLEPPTDRVIDGINILEPALLTPQPPLSRPLFWRTGGYKVVQLDGWKLQLQEQNGKTWLYNLNDDPTEQHNLSKTHPKKLNELRDVLYDLDRQMIEPLWPALVESPIAVDYTIDKLPDTDYETILWSN